MAETPVNPESRGHTGEGRGREPVEENTPLWVKVFGMIAVVLILLFIILHLSGGGMGGHTH